MLYSTMILIILFALLFSMVKARSIITTVAGIGGSSGFSGDGGLAKSARLSYPFGVFVDTSGNLYIADDGNHVVRKVDVNGVITTVAGTGGSPGFSGDGELAISAQLRNPCEVYIDISGNLYIVDGFNHVVRKVDADGVIISVAGTGGFPGFSGDGGLAKSARLTYPTSLCIDTSGNLYIADTGNHVVRKVDAYGVITTVAGTGGSPGFSGDGGLATSARLSSPRGVYIDITGNIYIAEESNHIIRKIDTSGLITTVAGTGGFPGFNGGFATSARLRSMRRFLIYSRCSS